MAKNGASKEYSFGTKNHWRRTIWNEVIRRVGTRAQTETILYLAGSADIDRKVATAKGIPDRSLFAIDRDRGNVAAVRAEHNKAIDAEALDLLWSWPEKRQVCAALLDFCGGISNANLGVFDALQRESLRNAVVVLNLQRGRDTASVSISKALDEAGLLQPIWRGRIGDDDEDNLECLNADLKHRGYLYLMYHALDSCAIAFGHAVGEDYGSAILPPNPTAMQTMRIPLFQKDSALHLRFTQMMGSFLLNCNPKFYSYRSGNLIFDSVVFEHPLRHLAAQSLGAVTDALLESHRNRVFDLSCAYSSKKIQNKISAVFAVATQRLKKWL